MKIIVWPYDCDSGAQVKKSVSSKTISKEFDVNEISCMEWAKTILKLQVRETFSSTIVRESAAEIFWAPDDMKVEGFFKHRIPWFVKVGVWYCILDLV